MTEASESQYEPQVDVILKSVRLQKQYNLEASKNDKLKNIASFLKDLKEVG